MLSLSSFGMAYSIIHLYHQFVYNVNFLLSLGSAVINEFYCICIYLFIDYLCSMIGLNLTSTKGYKHNKYLCLFIYWSSALG